MLLRVGVDLVSIYRPGVLGVASNISVAQIIEETNIERQQKGLAPLKENPSLDAAARAKAANMFEENYWAHFSPSGKDPWGFMSRAGYKYVYAGENLAKNFQTSGEVVKAWMNSPSHRDNLLNSRYEEIGIAVLDGTLQGQQTTLVVQMFGKPHYTPVAAAPNPLPEVKSQTKEIALEPAEAEVKTPIIQVEERTKVAQSQSVVVAGSTIQNKSLESKPLIDPSALMKTFGLALISLISFLLLLDFIVLRRRGVFRVSSHHLAHLGFLAISGAAVAASSSGDILQGLAFYIR